jgi:hypothetical protein
MNKGCNLIKLVLSISEQKGAIALFNYNPELTYKVLRLELLRLELL